MRRGRRSLVAATTVVLCLVLLPALAGWVSIPRPATDPPTAATGDAPDPIEVFDEPLEAAPGRVSSGPSAAEASLPEVTLGFAGDVHFERHLAGLLDGSPEGRLGPITPALRSPDLMMVNLEAAITTRGEPEPKQYAFRASPQSLDVLASAGVDIVTMANNHGADYGALGLADTLAAIDASPIPVVGIGRNEREAFAPHRVRIRGTDIAVFGVSQRQEHTFRNWSARSDRAGIATSIRPRPRLLRPVRRAAENGDLVVVYLHWGRELEACPTPVQREMAQALAEAGADVVVGTHAHVLLGAGWLGDTYVSYGLGNFIWYHNYRPRSGVLTVTVRDGQVVADDFVPAMIGADGLPFPVAGDEAALERWRWERLRGCTGLAGVPLTSR